LIVYGTRYGATASTSEDIAALSQEGFEVNVVNAKQDKMKDISEYELAIVGSGIQIGRWTKNPEKFIKKFQKELRKKKVALFVCCGSAHPSTEEDVKPEDIEKASRKYLEEKAAKYKLQPIAMGFFGGIYNFNDVSWLFRKFMASVKPQLEAAGYTETKPGIYDTRDINAIRSWAKELAQKVQYRASVKLQTSCFWEIWCRGRESSPRLLGT
jgi:menaquinone-dependent protoporphyrinogen oxidase